MSGYGKELGSEALDFYSQTKTIYVEMGDVDESSTYF
jgi:acyl-CoA reductase-like NAD-dependent aldehyde dehydrogenase